MADLFTPRAKPSSPQVARSAIGEKEKESHLLEHFCAICGAPAQWGFGVALLKGHPGRWGCVKHRGEVENMKTASSSEALGNLKTGEDKSLMQPIGDREKQK
jgi:hypothetical protein